MSVAPQSTRRDRRHTWTAGASVVLGLLCGLLAVTPASAATVDGLAIHSTVTGTGQTTVFLVHGYTCDETSWTEQVPALASRYRVVTVDLPGHGKSDVPRVEQFSMELFARAIEAVRAEVGAGRIVLVGHSMGTPVILKYANLYPQHTSALVFVDGLMPPAASANGRGRGAASDGAPRPATGAASGAGARMGGPNGRANREAMIQRFFLPSTTPAVRQKVLDMMLGAPESTAVGAMNASSDPAGRTTDVPAVPMLGIYAEPGPLASRETVLRNFPAAEYVQVPGTGHFLMLEKPAEFNAILLGFLAKLR